MSARKTKNAPAPQVKRSDWPAIRLAYRHLTGLEYDGEARTNATWTERGDKVMHPTGRARRWNYRPRIQRAAIRWGWTAAAAGEGYLGITSPALAAGTLQGAGGAATMWAGYRTSEAALGFAHRRRVVRPLAKALARPLETDPVNILRDLAVPVRTDRPNVVVTVPVPDGWHGDRKAVESVVTARLGGNWEAEWRMHQAPFSVEFTRSPEPPGMVKWSSILDMIADNAPGEVVVGLDSRSKAVRGDFVREEPMWGLSIGSGGGKSVFLWSVAAQLIAQGAEIVGIDPKYISLDPLVGIPGVTIHNDPRNVQGMWDAIREFREELEDRFDKWTQDRSLKFTRKVLILEEGNMFSDISKDYWRDVKKKGDPASPPVWGDIAAILRMGRQANMNVVAVFQRMDDAATGGRGLRDSFGFRMLGRFTWQGWRMLVGTNPIPRSQKRRGRFIVVDGGAHTWVQAPYVTEEEVRSFCLDARQAQRWGSAPAGVTPDVTSHTPESFQVTHTPPASVTRDVTPPRLVLVKDTPEPQEAPAPAPAEVPAPRHSLASAAREGVVPMSADALRQAKRRPGFPPAGDDGKWSAEQLTEWFANRPGNKAAPEKEAAGE